MLVVRFKNRLFLNLFIFVEIYDGKQTKIIITFFKFFENKLHYSGKFMEGVKINKMKSIIRTKAHNFL